MLIHTFDVVCAILILHTNHDSLLAYNLWSGSVLEGTHLFAASLGCRWKRYHLGLRHRTVLNVVEVVLRQVVSLNNWIYGGFFKLGIPKTMGLQC
jgi:hypothetical protein